MEIPSGYCKTLDQFSAAVAKELQRLDADSVTKKHELNNTTHRILAGIGARAILSEFDHLRWMLWEIRSMTENPDIIAFIDTWVEL